MLFSPKEASTNSLSVFKLGLHAEVFCVLLSWELKCKFRDIQISPKEVKEIKGIFFWRDNDRKNYSISFLKILFSIVIEEGERHGDISAELAWAVVVSADEVVGLVQGLLPEVAGT